MELVKFNFSSVYKRLFFILDRKADQSFQPYIGVYLAAFSQVHVQDSYHCYWNSVFDPYSDNPYARISFVG